MRAPEAPVGWPRAIAPPRYRSAHDEPDLDLAAQTFIGSDTAAEVTDNLTCGRTATAASTGRERLGP